MKNEQCRYCNKPLKGRQALVNEPICISCYSKRLAIRDFMQATEPLRKLSRKRKKQALIDNVELRLDYNLLVPPEEYEQYNMYIKDED